MTQTETVIHIIDDDASFCRSTGLILQLAGYQVALFESGKQYLDNLPQSEPGCILLDLKMSPVSGLELQERLSNMGRYSPIIFLTGHGDIPTTVQAIKSGADNLLTKPVQKATLIAAIEHALANFVQVHADRSRLAHLQDLASRLTPREREVLSLVVRGNLNKQIAHVLGVSDRTVKVDRHSIMQKLEAHSLAEVISFAEQLGMMPAADEKTRANN